MNFGDCARNSPALLPPLRMAGTDSYFFSLTSLERSIEPCRTCTLRSDRPLTEALIVPYLPGCNFSGSMEHAYKQ